MSSDNDFEYMTQLNPNLTASQAAEFLGIKTTTLANWRMENKGPKYMRVGRMIRYRYNDVVEFRDRYVVEPESSVGIRKNGCGEK